MTSDKERQRLVAALPVDDGCAVTAKRRYVVECAHNVGGPYCHWAELSRWVFWDIAAGKRLDQSQPELWAEAIGQSHTFVNLEPAIALCDIINGPTVVWTHYDQVTPSTSPNRLPMRARVTQVQTLTAITLEHPK